MCLDVTTLQKKDFITEQNVIYYKCSEVREKKKPYKHIIYFKKIL